MYKIQISRFTPFWNNSDVNYPDFDLFDNQEIFTDNELQWITIPNGSFNWLQSNTGWVQIDVQQYKIDYLRVIDTYTNKYYYFFVIDFFDMTSKTVKLNLELDNWMTYGKNILDNLKNENPIVFFNKKHMNRYSIMDNIPTSTQETIIDKTFTHSKSFTLNTYDIKSTNSLKQFVDGTYTAPDLELIKNGSNISNNAIFVVKVKEFIDDLKKQYSDIISRYNIEDLGSTISMELHIPNAKDEIHSGCYYRSRPPRPDYPISDWGILPNNIQTMTKPVTISSATLNIFKDDLTPLTGAHLDASMDYSLSSGVLRGTLSFKAGFLNSPRETIESFDARNFTTPDTSTMRCFNIALDNGTQWNFTAFVRLHGKIPAQQPTPSRTTYNVNYELDQQHLLNMDELSNLAVSKVNVVKENFEIQPKIISSVRILDDKGAVATYSWGPQDNNRFKLKNGFYLYGVVSFPYVADLAASAVTNFLTSDPSNNLFVYIPILQTSWSGQYFSSNTRGNVESGFGTNLLGIISSPIPPTSLSDSAISIKALFSAKPPYTSLQFERMHAFVAPAFKNFDLTTLDKTPYKGDLYTAFTPPTTKAEIWEKKLTTLNWQNESLLNSPQFLEYYITNGASQINVNNYVNVTYADKNYLYIAWALTPISSLIFATGLFDLNRFESQKNVLAFSGILPCNSSSYNQWILENAASINMGLKSAAATRDKEIGFGIGNTFMGLLQMSMGGAMGSTGFSAPIQAQTGQLIRPHTRGRRPKIELPYVPAEFGGAFWGGSNQVQQGMGGFIGGIDRIETAKLNYANYERQISGMNSDAQTKTTIITSDDSSYVNTFSAITPLSIIYMGLKPNDCLTVWWNCLLNGYSVNRSFNFKEYDNRTYYNYLNVTDISPWILSSKETPQVYKEWFISKFSEGIRLWKTWLDFNLDNKEKFIDRIDNALTVYARNPKNGKR